MSETSQNAVSLYNQDGGLDDFPVLRAFQQYIDNEQAKARKRLITLGIFFCVMMLLMVAIFVTLLIGVSERNQKLNDRLVEYAMRERSAAQPVVVQSSAPVQDNSAILTLTAKLEEMQQKLLDSQKQVAEATKAAEAASKAKEPTAEELEILRLKTLLAAEKDRAAAEKERLHQQELEEYRRKRWPELYAPQPSVAPLPQSPAVAQPTMAAPASAVSQVPVQPPQIAVVAEEKPVPVPRRKLSDADFELDDDHAVDYFGDETDDEASDEDGDLEAEAENVSDDAEIKQPEAEDSADTDAERLPLKKAGTRSVWRVPLN